MHDDCKEKSIHGIGYQHTIFTSLVEDRNCQDYGGQSPLTKAQSERTVSSALGRQTRDAREWIRPDNQVLNLDQSLIVAMIKDVFPKRIKAQSNESFWKGGRLQEVL